MADIQLIDTTGTPADISHAIAFNNSVFRAMFTNSKLQLPGGGPALCWGTGVPARTDVTNGDLYWRIDGTAGACIYQRRTGAWVATGA